MKIDGRLVAFGLFLITVGGVMVAVRQGLIEESVASRAWSLWPLILVGAGLSVALAGRPGASIGGLIVAVTLGAMLGGVASGGAFPTMGFCGGDRDEGTAFPNRSGDLSGSANVTIVQGCGDLDVGTVAGSTWNVSGLADNGIAPEIDSTSNLLRIESPDRSFADFGGTSSWDVVLPRDPSLDLELTLNGGDSRLALAGAHLDRVTVAANAASVDLDLREIETIDSLELDLNFGSATIHLPSRSASIKLDVNAGSAALCLPSGAGLRVELDSVAASSDFDRHGMIRNDNTWETPGYASAEIRLEVEADVNAGSLSLDPSRSCAG